MVTVYTRPRCPYCVKAKNLLDGLGIEYIENNLDPSPESAQKLFELTGGKTYPQIVIDKQVVGGCDDLYALHESGKLGKKFPQIF